MAVAPLSGRLRHMGRVAAMEALLEQSLRKRKILRRPKRLSHALGPLPRTIRRGGHRDDLHSRPARLMLCGVVFAPSQTHVWVCRFTPTMPSPLFLPFPTPVTTLMCSQRSRTKQQRQRQPQPCPPPGPTVSTSLATQPPLSPYENQASAINR